MRRYIIGISSLFLFVAGCQTSKEPSEERLRAVLKSRVDNLSRILEKRDNVNISHYPVIVTGIEAIKADLKSQIDEVSREICSLDMFECLKLEY